MAPTSLEGSNVLETQQVAVLYFVNRMTSSAQKAIAVHATTRLGQSKHYINAGAPRQAAPA